MEFELWPSELKASMSTTAPSIAAVFKNTFSSSSFFDKMWEKDLQNRCPKKSNQWTESFSYKISPRKKVNEMGRNICLSSINLFHCLFDKLFLLRFFNTQISQQFVPPILATNVELFNACLPAMTMIWSFFCQMWLSRRSDIVKLFLNHTPSLVALIGFTNAHGPSPQHAGS